MTMAVGSDSIPATLRPYNKALKPTINPPIPTFENIGPKGGVKQRVTGEVMLRSLLGSRGYMYPIHTHTGSSHWNIKPLMRT